MSDGHVEHLFVYGTLRSGSGHPMHEVLARAAEMLGPATVAGRLYRVDWYPAFVADASAGRVHGDLWRLRERAVLRTLDDYEGDEYVRRIVEIVYAGDQAVAAFAYVFTAPLAGLARLDSGDWLAQS